MKAKQEQSQTSIVVSFRLSHKGGANDEVWACEHPRAAIPRIGEYVTVGDIVHGIVYDVNYDYGISGEKAEAKVYLLCDGEADICDWNCDREYVRENRR